MYVLGRMGSECQQFVLQRVSFAGLFLFEPLALATVELGAWFLVLIRMSQSWGQGVYNYCRVVLCVAMSLLKSCG